VTATNGINFFDDMMLAYKFPWWSRLRWWCWIVSNTNKLHVAGNVESCYM